MQPLNFSFAQDPNTLSLAIIYGMIPAIAWVFFWLRENKERKRRGGLLMSLFIGGAFMVIVTLPVQQWIATLSTNMNVLNVLWAAAEELLKFAIFAVIVLSASSKNIIDPIDYPIYIIMAALGFAGFENALYFLGPLQAGSTTSILLNGSMRFLGTTLLHAASSSLIGISLGFAYFKSKRASVVYCIFGIAAAIALHSTFNYYIVQNQEQNFFQVFGFLWIATILIMVMLEWLRKMGSAESRIHREHAFFDHIEALFKDVLAISGSSTIDAVPITELLAKKGAAEGGPEFKKLKTLISSLRALYSAYLVVEGTKAGKTSNEVALSMVPDTISGQGFSTVITTLKKEVESSMRNAAPITRKEINVPKDVPVHAPVAPIAVVSAPLPRLSPNIPPPPPPAPIVPTHVSVSAGAAAPVLKAIPPTSTQKSVSTLAPLPVFVPAPVSISIPKIIVPPAPVSASVPISKPTLAPTVAPKPISIPVVPPQPKAAPAPIPPSVLSSTNTVPPPPKKPEAPMLNDDPFGQMSATPASAATIVPPVTPPAK